MSDWAYVMSGWDRQLSVEWRARLDERLGSCNERLGSST